MLYDPSAPLSMTAVTCFIVLLVWVSSMGLLHPYLLFYFCTCSVLYFLTLVATYLNEVVFIWMVVYVMTATVSFELPTVADSQFL